MREQPLSDSASSATEWAECAPNVDAVARAHDLIRLRRFVVGTDWAECAPDRARRVDYIERHSWDDYALWHLGLTDGAGHETLARYDFAYGDFTRVHRSALVACAAQASRFHDRGIEQAANDLIAVIDGLLGSAG